MFKIENLDSKRKTLSTDFIIGGPGRIFQSVGSGRICQTVDPDTSVGSGINKAGRHKKRKEKKYANESKLVLNVKIFYSYK